MDSSIKQNPIFLKYAIGIGLLFVLVLPFYYWLITLGDISIYFSYDIPPGQAYYIFSKLTGMYALVLIWAQIVLALLKQSSFRQSLSFWNVNFHRRLGLSAAFCVALHAGLFVAAVSIRKAEFAYGLLLPNFTHGFYAFSVTLGVLAVYLILAVIITGFLQKNKSIRLTWIHRFAIVAFILAFIHSLLIGTETRFSFISLNYFLMAGLLLFALWARFYRPFTQKDITSS